MAMGSLNVVVDGVGWHRSTAGLATGRSQS
jgi:hypothetical protein